jgi:hypothetical protein
MVFKTSHLNFGTVNFNARKTNTKAQMILIIPGPCVLLSPVNSDLVNTESAPRGNIGLGSSVPPVTKYFCDLINT